MTRHDLKYILLVLGIINENTQCTACETIMKLHFMASKSTPLRFFCKTCNKYFDIRKFTKFCDYRVKILDILLLILLFCEENSYDEIQEATRLSRNTIAKIIDFIREKIISHMELNETMLGMEVEVDETLISRRKFNRGRFNEQQWLFGMIERGTGTFILKTVQRRDASTLGLIIQEYISQDSIVYSDQWGAYRRIFSNNQDYIHSSVNHSRNFVDPDDPTIHTQTVEALWSRLKRFLRNHSLRNRNNLEGYLAEFSFRKKYQNLGPNELFSKLIRIIYE